MAYSSINRVTVLGNVTRDPELRELPSGGSVCHIRLACNGRRRSADGGYESKPNFFDISAFGALGETVHRYLRKGRPVAVDGRLDWSEWENAEGERRQAVSIIAEDVQFLRGADREQDNEPDELQAGVEELAAAQVGAESELVV